MSDMSQKNVDFDASLFVWVGEFHCGSCIVMGGRIIV